MAEAHAAAETAPSNPTLNELFAAYLADRRNPHAERKCKHPASLASHLKIISVLWGTMTVNEFKVGSRGRVKAQAQAWREGGLSPHTVRKRVSILKTVFRFSLDEELIDRAQEPVIKLPPTGAPRERFLDPHTELPALLAAADQTDTPRHVRLNAELSLRTGQRQSAIRDLQWSKHIDFENRVILFRETEAIEDRSKKRRTNIPMDDALYALLMEAREHADSDWVIEWRGKRVNNCYHAMKRLYERAGIENLRLHDLRRTAATYVHRGTEGDMKAAASFIGDTEAIAQKHYVRQSAETLLRPVSAIANVMDSARSVRTRLAKKQGVERLGLTTWSLSFLNKLMEHGDWMDCYGTEGATACVLEDYGLIECDPSQSERELPTHRPGGHFRARALPHAANEVSQFPCTNWQDIDNRANFAPPLTTEGER